MVEAFYLFPPKRKKPDAPGFVGATIEAGGRKWRGGYRYGPLTGQEIDDLTAAGYADRIVKGDATQPPSRHPEDRR